MKRRKRGRSKKREEEELAAKTYAEFVDAFEGDGAQRKGRGFVRAGGEPAEYNPVGRGSARLGMKAFDDEPEVSRVCRCPFGMLSSGFLIVATSLSGTCSEAQRQEGDG